MLLPEPAQSKIIRAPRPKFPELETDLYSWIEIARRRKVNIPPQVIKLKAKELAKALSIDDFTASNGWYHRFAKRKGLKTVDLHGEGGSADDSIELQLKHHRGPIRTQANC